MKYFALLLICFLAGFGAGEIISYIKSYIKKKSAKPDDDWHGGHWPH